MGDNSNEDDWGAKFNSVCQRTFKLDRKAFNKMRSICQNAQIKKYVNETEIEFLAAQQTKTLNDAFESLGFNRNKDIFDSFMLVKFIDQNYDGRINRAEFLAHFEEHLYQLVMEEVLTKPFEKVRSTAKSPIDQLFPLENSTIGE